MKKRVLSMLLAVFMVVGMLPMTVWADDASQVYAESYSELVSYLNSTDPGLEAVIIAGKYWNASQGRYEEFDWEGATSLDLKTAVSSRDVEVSDTWTIPEGVTVNVHQQVYLQFNSPKIIVDGTWNIAHINGKVWAPYSYRTLTINEGGKLTIDEEYATFYVSPGIVGGEAKLVLNGTMDLTGHSCRVTSDWMLGEKAVVTGSGGYPEALYLENRGSIHADEGARVEVDVVAVQNAGSASLSGTLHIPKLQFTQGGTLTIPEGSHISTDELCYNLGNKTGTLNLDGTLELGEPETRIFPHIFKSNNAGDAVMNIGPNGVLKLHPYNYLATNNSVSSITGSGTIKMYALYDETDGSYKYKPAVYNSYGYNGRTSQLADTITLWRNWEREDLPHCSAHTWDLGAAEADLTTYTCTVCGTQKQEDNSQSGGSGGDVQIVDTTPMHRLYNPNSGEHFYTGSSQERDVLTAAGWAYEGIAWNAPTNSGDPVHRLFNPNNGDHHYTMSEAEKDMLVGVGWNYEGVCWNSAPADHSDSMGLYRLFNPNADCGSHHYTGSEEEKNMLVGVGWIYEGVGWFGMMK